MTRRLVLSCVVRCLEPLVTERAEHAAGDTRQHVWPRFLAAEKMAIPCADERLRTWFGLCVPKRPDDPPARRWSLFIKPIKSRLYHVFHGIALAASAGCS